VEIELVPEPDADDPARRAAVAGIEQKGLADDVRPSGSVGAWRRAGLLEAVERSVTVRDRGDSGHRGHAPTR
jgi:hypothetical protein